MFLSRLFLLRVLIVGVCLCVCCVSVSAQIVKKVNVAAGTQTQGYSTPPPTFVLEEDGTTDVFQIQFLSSAEPGVVDPYAIYFSSYQSVDDYHFRATDQFFENNVAINNQPSALIPPSLVSAFNFRWYRSTPTSATENSLYPGFNQHGPDLRLTMVTTAAHILGANRVLELVWDWSYEHSTDIIVGSWQIGDYFTAQSLVLYLSKYYFDDVNGHLYAAIPGNTTDFGNRNNDASCSTGQGYDTFSDWLAGTCLNHTFVYGFNPAYGTNGGSDPSDPIITYVDDIKLQVGASQLITYDFTLQSSASGDPQLVGLRGQSFQVHGIDGAIYNLVSDPLLQLNSKFVFLDAGRCPTRKQSGPSQAHTNCWSHPGSYLGAIGMQQILGKELIQIAFIAGPLEEGYASVTVNGTVLNIGQSSSFYSLDNTSHVTIGYPHSHFITIETPLFDFEFDNSDSFINQRFSPNVPLTTVQARNVHGLLGQTWNTKTHKGAVKYIEGEVDDYVVHEHENSDPLFGSDFVFNRFAA